MRLLLAGTVATFTAVGLAAITPAVITTDEKKAADTIREHRIRADTRFLSSDLLEGRAPGTRGDALAREYVASRFEAIGLEPAGPGGSWYQPVEMVGVTASCPKEVRVTSGSVSEMLRFGTDYVAFSGVQAAEARIADAEIVFVGYGIVAPEYRWDDYKGADLRGKVLLFMNNDPESDPTLFEGRRRLYYGRWDYKFSKAAELGAAGAIIIHTDHSAGYNWQVVQSSWSDEQLSLPAADEPTLQVKAWLTEDASHRIARLGGYDLDGLRATAQSRDFRPVPLRVRLRLLLKNSTSRRTSANVIGRLPGRDPVLGREAVLYTAHHDHLGLRKGPAGEPVVYNGALDDAAGVAAMLAIAEAFTALPERPRRSILFASVTAEESGLLGSETLARNPPVAPGRLVADVNLDGVNIWGRTRDVAVVGLGKSSLDDWIRTIAGAQDRVVVPESFPDKGSYYRSDHVSFAQIGVPSVYIDVGTEVRGRPSGWGRERQEAWEAANYHQPTDDLTNDWDLSGAIEDTQLLFLLGAKVADTPLRPSWRPGDEFEAARKKALSAIGAQ